MYFSTFSQLSARLKSFLGGWSLVLGIKECATVCVKNVVILTIFATDDTIVFSNVFTGMHIIAFIDFSNGFHISITINHMGKPCPRYSHFV